MAPLYSTSIQVQAPREQVFDYLAALERHPEWSGSVEFGLQSLEVLDPPPVRIGTRFHSVGRNATGTPNVDLSQIAILERPQRIGWDTSFRLGLARARFAHRYTLTDSVRGTTLAYALERAQPLNAVGFLLLLYLKYVVGKRGEEVVLSGLRAFQKAAEREANQTQAATSAPAAGELLRAG